MSLYQVWSTNYIYLFYYLKILIFLNKSNGKILWAKNLEVRTANLKSVNVKD